jgi:predicted MPP superfamily phosphohydrolase
MKCVVIGDIHGRDCWKQIVVNEQPDRVIFIGDYFDSYDNYTAAEQMHNFKEIIEYKESGKSEVIVLIGNHDYHYMRGINEHYSGYQSGARPAIEQLLYENKNHMKMAYGMNGFIFTHAGVSMDWLQIHGYDNESNLIDWINDMWKYKPNTFSFAGRDPYGDSKISSPIWIRPYSLQAANRDTLRDQFIQVVGHTTQGKIDTEGKSTGGRYYYIDTLGTSGQYMILEQISTDNGEIKFNTYKNETVTT